MAKRKKKRKKKSTMWQDRLRAERIRSVREAMEKSEGLVPEAAVILGIGERTLRRWLNELKLGHLSRFRRGGEYSKRSRIEEAAS